MSAASLDLTVEKEGVGGLTGLDPTVALRDASSTDSYFDWSDSSFKTSGWTTKYATMEEVERGHYRLSLDLTVTPAIMEGMTVVAEYHVDNGSSVIGDAHDVISVVNPVEYILEIYQLMGLDPAKPLTAYINATSGLGFRKVGDGSEIDQTVVRTGTTTTVTRNT